jgi:hypothetical protein
MSTVTRRDREAAAVAADYPVDQELERWFDSGGEFETDERVCGGIDLEAVARQVAQARAEGRRDGACAVCAAIRPLSDAMWEAHAEGKMGRVSAGIYELREALRRY